MKRLLVLAMAGILALPAARVLVAPSFASGAALGREDQALEASLDAEWRAADAAMAAGETLARRSPDAARVDFLAAAAGYGRVASARPSPQILYNLGTARLRAGDPGRAIAALRASLLVDPSSEDARSNLEQARRSVEDGAGGPADRTVDAIRAFWAPHRNAVLVVGWLAWCVGLAALGLSSIDTTGVHRRLGGWGSVLAVIGGLCLSTILVDRLAVGSERSAVLVATTTLRAGNGSGFPPLLTRPLPAGSECTALEGRPGWTQIELADGTRGWVESDRVERIAPMLRAR